jgi:hypothetical protein
MEPDPRGDAEEDGIMRLEEEAFSTKISALGIACGLYFNSIFPLWEQTYCALLFGRRSCHRVQDQHCRLDVCELLHCLLHCDHDNLLV